MKEYIAQELTTFGSSLSREFKQEMSEIEISLQTKIQMLEDRISAQEESLEALKKTVKSINKSLEGFKVSVEENLEAKERFDVDIKAIQRGYENTSQKVDVLSAAALTSESVDSKVEACLQPLRDEVSSLGIRLDTNISAINLEVAKNATEAAKVEDIAKLADSCAVLKSLLDAVPRQTEEQITSYLASTVGKIRHLKNRLEARLNRSSSERPTLAAELEAAQNQTSIRAWFPSVLFKAVVDRALNHGDQNFKLTVTLVAFAVLLGVAASIDTWKVLRTENEVAVDYQSLISHPEDQVFVYSFYPVA